MTDSSSAVFVLYGATGDLARRMVLPAFYQLAQHGLLPEAWVLVGSGRGRPVPRGLPRAGARRARGVRPGPRRRGLAVVRGAPALRRRRLQQGRRGRAARRARAGAAAGRRRGAARALPGRAARRLPPASPRRSPLHGLAEGARVVYEKPFGTSPGGLPRARRAGARRARRAAGLPHRPLPGQGGHAGPARPALRQRAVRRTCGAASTYAPCRSTCPRRSTSPTGPSSTTGPARCSTWW